MSNSKKVFAIAIVWMFVVVGFFGSIIILPEDMAYADSTKIALDSSMVTKESGQGDAGLLVDEQALAGDPRNGDLFEPQTVWQSGYQLSDYPSNAYIDLGQVYTLTDIYYFTRGGSGDVVISTGEPGNWTVQLTKQSEWLEWHELQLGDIETRYVRVTRDRAGSKIAEIVVYGIPTSGTTPPVDGPPPAAITDLTLGYVTGSSVQLSWTATGHNETVGTAVYQDIRYSTMPIDDLSWSAATQVVGESTPYPAGYDQAYNVTGLTANTTYYFAIKAVNQEGEASPLSNAPSATTGSGLPGAKIILDSTMLINETHIGDINKTIDEQDLSGDPKNGTEGNPSTQWELGWGAMPEFLPLNFVIDLGAEYDLTDVYFFDVAGNGNVEISTGSPGDWTLQITEPLTRYNKWNAHSLSGVTSRYVQVSRFKRGANFAEIVIYGTPQAAVTPPSPPSPTISSAAMPMDQIIGINAFIDDPLDKMAVAGSIREYHNWEWDEEIQDQRKFNPSYAGGGWDFDAYYNKLHEVGITVSPVIQGSPSWASGTSELNLKPVLLGQDPNLPSSYASHASQMYQFAARYGSTNVPTGNLKLAADQQPLTGLNVLEYFEDWNEQNIDWVVDRAFPPYHYAAMASADYDGDQGRLGTTYGVKNADPNAKLVMGGLWDMLSSSELSSSGPDRSGHLLKYIDTIKF